MDLIETERALKNLSKANLELRLGADERRSCGLSCFPIEALHMGASDHVVIAKSSALPLFRQ